MNYSIHPKYEKVKVICSCGNKFETSSTLQKEIHLDVCNKCHPFYTGSQRVVDSSGRVDGFKKRFGGLSRKL